jgi:hypothetical protein
VHKARSNKAYLYKIHRIGFSVVRVASSMRPWPVASMNLNFEFWK